MSSRALYERRELAIGYGSIFVDEGDRSRLYSPVPENRLDEVHPRLSDIG